MDDVTHVVDATAPAPVMRVLLRLTRMSSYGPGLSLLRTRGKEAFGFRWNILGSDLTVEQELKWVPDFQTYKGITAPTAF